MSKLELKLNELNPKLYSDLQETKQIVSKLLQQYIKNFPTYTDHSIEHTQEVLDIAGNLLTKTEVNSLNADEIYVLSMACILHDVGMCIPESKIKLIEKTEDLIEYRRLNPDYSRENYIRDIHHILSLKFINDEWRMLKIPSEKYAEAIGLVAQGHRKVDIDDFDVYDPQFFVHSGRDFICLPYLACIIRIADELDITNARTPEILLKYYIPDNDISKIEWNKHKSTILVNFKGSKVIIQAKCTDNNMLSALEGLFDKIKNVINNCQKIIGSLQQIEDRSFSLTINSIEPKFIFEDFDPKGIKYSFEVKNVINAFVGEELYENKDAAIRELIQNALDACNYKKALIKNEYLPEINIYIDDETISVSDNGLGMDEFIIENYFGKLASSYYQQDSVKNDFQSIGQFGIGVFSYFLIADYIDVETKKINKKSLRFRTDKDPNGYFHFFDGFNKEEEGSKITLYLKDIFRGKYTIERVNSYLQETFPFINVPIHLSDGKESLTMKTDEMKIDFNKDIYPHLYYNSQKTSNALKLISVEHKTADFEGVLSLVVPRTFEKSKVSIRNLFDHHSFEKKANYLNDFSLVSIAQKGVLISNYGANNLEFAFGKVNLLQKLNLNLSRTEFTNDKDVENVLDILEAKLIQKTFEELLNIDEFQTLSHLKKTEWFLKLYWENSTNSSLINNAIKNLFCFELFNNGKNEYLTLENIGKKYNKFIIFSSKIEAKENLGNLTWPYLIIDFSYGYGWILYNLFNTSINYGYSVVKLNELYFLTFDKDKFNEEKDFQQLAKSYGIYSNFGVFDDESIIGVNFYDKRENIKKNEYFRMREGTRINIKHVFFNKFFNYIKCNKLNSTQIRLFKEFIKILEMYFVRNKKSKRDVKKSISNANIIITKLNEDSMEKFPFLNLQDFSY